MGNNDEPKSEKFVLNERKIINENISKSHLITITNDDLKQI